MYHLLVLDCQTHDGLGRSLAAAQLTGLLTANLPHAAATAVTLALFGRALLRMLDRVQVKYGLLQD